MPALHSRQATTYSPISQFLEDRSVNGLKPSFSANPSHRSPFFFFDRIPRLFTVISEHTCFLLFSFFLFLHFLVVGCVR